MPQPDYSIIDDSGIWMGNELFQRNDWQLSLESSEVDALADAARASESIPTESMTIDDFPLPGLAEKFRNLQHSLENESGAAVIQGMSLDQFSESLAERIYFGVCLHLGTPISQSAKGEKIFHVRDAGFPDGDPRARGPNTSKKLSFHTDRCDVIGFLCLKQAQSGGENFLVHSMAVFNRILKTRPDLLQILCQPFHYLRHSVDTGNQHPWCRQPIFSVTEGKFACSFLRVLIDRAHQSDGVPNLTEIQIEALDYLEEVCEDPALHVRFYQRPGEMVFLNNWTTLHRRSEFVDHSDPAKKRHLLRAWLSMPNSRPIDPLFLDNFGAVDAGALRGGMRKAETQNTASTQS